MKDIKFSIYFTTTTLLTYIILGQFYTRTVTSFITMIAFSPVLMIWMLYRVINDGGPRINSTRLSLGQAADDFNFFHRDMRD